MTRDDLLAFMRAEKFAVQASVSRTYAPQAAVVGIAVSDDFEEQVKLLFAARCLLFAACESPIPVMQSFESTWNEFCI